MEKKNFYENIVEIIIKLKINFGYISFYFTLMVGRNFCLFLNKGFYKYY